MEVRWSTPAAQDLERIFRGIEKDNPTAAREVVKTIYDGCEALKDFPHRGRPRTHERAARTQGAIRSALLRAVSRSRTVSEVEPQVQSRISGPA